MTPEQQAYYLHLGLETDVKHKAGALKQAMVDMQEAMNRSTGYNAVQFKPLIEAMHRRLVELDEAIAAKESLK